MQAKPYTHAEASEDSFRHVSSFIPEHLKAGDHFASAMHHAKQISKTTGQSKAEHRLNWFQHILEGLNDQSSS